MKKLIPFVILIFFYLSTYSQTGSRSYQNLKFDFEKYSSAMLNKNEKEIEDLLYPDIFTSLKENYPNEFNAEMIDQFLKSLVGSFEEAEKMGFKADIRNDGDIIKIVDLSTKEIWLIELLIDFKNSNRIIETNSAVLGVSLNGGKDFTFLAYDSEFVRDVLKYEFSDNSIQDVLRIGSKYSD